MSNNNDEKKKALLAYKEKILDEIKHYERSIEDFRANLKNNNNFYDDPSDSSDSEDDFPPSINTGPSVPELKLQQSSIKTCLQATEELTSLTILQSSVDVLVDEPKFEGERPVKEAGTWREIIAECRIDLIHFTMTFFMHTPQRKFGPLSYRGLRVVPVKPGHERELAKSVLHSLKVPSDAVEVLRSYAAGYRSRRTTLARLANKYTNALFMEPHPEGGFVMKCADLLEVSWRLENKRSPVAPFHHTMKFDLEFMEESYVKIIAQAHKQLLNPAIPTDERTLLLAKIITTCLEARGPIDPESDLESKTTERDNDIDKRDSDTEKKDSEVMAPPKSLPKKGKQKNKEANTAQKRSIDDDNDDSRAKKMKNAAPEAKKSIVDANNPRKTKMNDGTTENGKKRKISEVHKVANAKIFKESDNTEDANVNTKEDKTVNNKTKNKQSKNNAKTMNLKEAEEKTANTNSKPKNMKESVTNDDKNSKTKNEITKETGETADKESIAKPKAKNLKEPTNILKEPSKIDSTVKTKTKMVKKTGKTLEKDVNDELTEKNTKNVQNKGSTTKNNTNKEPANTEKGKNNINKAKNVPTKETGNSEHNNQDEKAKHIEKKKPKTVTNTKSKENIDANKDAGHPVKRKISEKTTNNEKNTNTETQKINNKPKDDPVKEKKVPNTKKDNQATKKNPETNINVASTEKDEQPKKFLEKKITNKEKVSEVANKGTEKNKITNKEKVSEVANKGTEKNKIINKEKVSEVANKGAEKNKVTNKEEVSEVANKGTEKNKITNKEKVSEVANKGAEKNIKEKTANTNVKNVTQIVKKVAAKNATNVRNKEKILQIANKVTEKVIKEKPLQLKEVPEKVLSSNLNSKKTKEPVNITKKIKKPMITKIASHRNSLKPQNPPKVLKADNPKAIATGNTEKENGGKGSKIPQKKMSIISEGSSKRNMLRISPRKLPSKYKTISQEKQKMVKSTNIPRLLKKPAPKTTNGKFK